MRALVGAAGCPQEAAGADEGATSATSTDGAKGQQGLSIRMAGAAAVPGAGPAALAFFPFQ